MPFKGNEQNVWKNISAAVIKHAPVTKLQIRMLATYSDWFCLHVVRFCLEFYYCHMVMHKMYYVCQSWWIKFKILGRIPNGKMSICNCHPRLILLTITLLLFCEVRCFAQNRLHICDIDTAYLVYFARSVALKWHC